MRKKKDPDQTLWIMDVDPGGPKICGFGSGSGSGSPKLFWRMYRFFLFACTCTSNDSSDIRSQILSYGMLVGKNAFLFDGVNLMFWFNGYLNCRICWLWPFREVGSASQLHHRGASRVLRQLSCHNSGPRVRQQEYKLHETTWNCLLFFWFSVWLNDLLKVRALEGPSGQIRSAWEWVSLKRPWYENIPLVHVL